MFPSGSRGGNFLGIETVSVQDCVGTFVVGYQITVINQFSKFGKTQYGGQCIQNSYICKNTPSSKTFEFSLNVGYMLHMNVMYNNYITKCNVNSYDWSINIFMWDICFVVEN
jgi:hypothetical protein